MFSSHSIGVPCAPPTVLVHHHAESIQQPFFLLRTLSVGIVSLSPVIVNKMGRLTRCCPLCRLLTLCSFLFAMVSAVLFCIGAVVNAQDKV